MAARNTGSNSREPADISDTAAAAAAAAAGAGAAGAAAAADPLEVEKTVKSGELGGDVATDSERKSEGSLEDRSNFGESVSVEKKEDETISDEDAEVAGIMGEKSGEEDNDYDGEVREVVDEEQEINNQVNKSSPEIVTVSSSSSTSSRNDRDLLGDKKREPDVVELTDDEDGADEDEDEDDGRADDDGGNGGDSEAKSEAEDQSDPNREPGADAVRFIDPDHLVPFRFGWKREVVKRQASKTSVTQFDVYYVPPADAPYRTREAKRKRRSKADQEKYFEDFPSKDMSVINFNYVRRPLGLNNAAYEIIRKSKPQDVVRDTKVEDGKIPKDKKIVSYKEVEESAGLLMDDESDDEGDQLGVVYKGGYDIDMPVCAQVTQRTPGMRLEHKRRRKCRVPETSCTPPLAEDMLWAQLDEDPLGVFNDLGGRSSPSTPPPLRAVQLTRSQTAVKIAGAFSKVREEAGKLELLKEPELKENLASHDVAIKHFKNFVENSKPVWRSQADTLLNLPGISVSLSRSFGISSQPKGANQLFLQQPNRKRMNLQRHQPQQPRGVSGGVPSDVRVRLPMKSVNGKRPVVELVMEQNGRYQPIKFSNNMQITESIPRIMFDQANALRRTFYLRATKVSRVGGRRIFLAINPSSTTSKDSNSPSNGGLLQAPPQVRQGRLQPQQPLQQQHLGKKPQLQQPHQTSALSRRPIPQEPSDQVAILVKPQKGTKHVLLNVPRKVAVKVKPGTTLSFSASSDQKYIVVDSKIHPPVGKKPVSGGNLTAPLNGGKVKTPMQQQSRPSLNAIQPRLPLPPALKNQPQRLSTQLSKLYNSPTVSIHPVSKSSRTLPNVLKTPASATPTSTAGVKRTTSSSSSSPSPLPVAQRPPKSRKVLASGEV